MKRIGYPKFHQRGLKSTLLSLWQERASLNARFTEAIWSSCGALHAMLLSIEPYDGKQSSPGTSR